MPATTPLPAPASGDGHAPHPAEHLSIVAVSPTGDDVAVTGLEGLARAFRDERLRLWVDLTDTSPDLLAAVGQILGLHQLIAEDIVERNQRAKFEEVDGFTHIVLFAIRHAGEIVESEVDFVLGPRFLLTVHDPEWDPHAAPHLRLGSAALLHRGPDYVLYAICDWMVDGYFPALDRLGDEIDQLQDDAMQRPSHWTLERLFTLKREILHLRRAAAPAREIFTQLTSRGSGLVHPDHVVYFRDVYDHLIRVTDELDNFRELVAGAMDVYLSTVNNNLSLIMKRLTGVTVILAGVGAVGGLFGMSEAGAAFSGAEAGGFWLVFGGTLIAAAIVALVLRRIDWI